MMEQFLKVWQIILDILFPALCLHCRSHLQTPEEKENLLCYSSFSNIKIYSNIFKPDPRLNLIAIGSYGDTALKELIHYLKYNRFLAAQIPLEKLIVKWLTINKYLISSLFPCPVASSALLPGCLILPIPLHKNRLRHRGFNQAELIGEILSRHLNLPLRKDILERARDTKPQIAMKNEKEREENLKKSFRLNPQKAVLLAQFQSVILVDDVYTSGGTMKEAAKALRRAGVKNITAFVVVKT